MTYAMVSSAVMAKNTAHGKPLQTIVGVYAADQYFICLNNNQQEYGNFVVLEKLNPENELDREKIIFFERGMKDGTYNGNKEVHGIVNTNDKAANHRSGRGKDHYTSSERGQANTDVARLRTGDSRRSNQLGFVDESVDDSSRGEIDERVKHSLGITAVSEAEKSLAAKVTALEQINRDLERQVKDYRMQAQAGDARHRCHFPLNNL